MGSKQARDPSGGRYLGQVTITNTNCSSHVAVPTVTVKGAPVFGAKVAIVKTGRKR